MAESFRFCPIQPIRGGTSGGIPRANGGGYAFVWGIAHGTENPYRIDNLWRRWLLPCSYQCTIHSVPPHPFRAGKNGSEHYRMWMRPCSWVRGGLPTLGQRQSRRSDSHSRCRATMHCVRHLLACDRLTASDSLMALFHLQLFQFFQQTLRITCHPRISMIE